MLTTAVEQRLTLIKQNVCLESVLLRHFTGHENDNPATAADALRRLRNAWPEYQKGMPAIDLELRIQLADVKRAAESPLNPDLRVLLFEIGFL